MHFIPEADFTNILANRKFYEAASKSLLPYTPGGQLPTRTELPQFHAKLYDDIRTNRYFPSVPRGYLFQEKSNGVGRIIPVFTYADLCVYYFCVRVLEDHLAAKRLPNTFGGWKLGNSLRELENANLDTTERDDAPYEGDYSPPASINRAKWSEEWIRYQEMLSVASRNASLEHFVTLDISNFYDNINLHMLEAQLRQTTPESLSPIVTLLLLFLSHWNRDFEGYSRKTVGLPQDEMGDASRLLANFYLQPYDRSISSFLHLIDSRSQYFRYADDQVFMTSSELAGREALRHSSMELHKIGLNANNSKVKHFSDWALYEEFRAKEIFELLRDGQEDQSYISGAEMYITWMETKEIPWRSDSVLKRLLKVGINRFPQNIRERIVEFALNPSILAKCDYWMLNRIYSSLSEKERICLLDRLDELANHTQFSFFLYSCLKLHRLAKTGRDTGNLLNRIEAVKLAA